MLLQAINKNNHSFDSLFTLNFKDNVILTSSCIVVTAKRTLVRTRCGYQRGRKNHPHVTLCNKMKQKPVLQYLNRKTNGKGTRIEDELYTVLIFYHRFVDTFNWTFFLIPTGQSSPSKQADRQLTL